MKDYRKTTNSEFNLSHSLIDYDFSFKDYLLSKDFELIKDNDSTTEFQRKIFYQEINDVIDVNIFIHHNIIYNMFSSLGISVFADGDRIYKGLIPVSNSSMNTLMSLLFPSMNTISIAENRIMEKENKKNAE